MFRKKPSPPVNVEWLIVGLGNPGPEYNRTRHNVGFDCIDALGEAFKIKIDKAKHRARYGIGSVDGVGVALIKPMTFMNASGQSVKPMLQEFSLKPDRILIIADDLDMVVGRVRLKPKGSAGGHNGHKSLIAALGTEDYARLKIGIGSEKRGETVDFVLSKFHPEERVDIDQAIKRCIRGIESLTSEGIEKALNVINETQT
jgi:peptidyl-tRNA hydrolase, PTH1 family